MNTNGAAARVIDFDRLGKKARPGTFGKIKGMLSGVPPKVPRSKKHDIRSDPLVLTPFVPGRTW